MERHCLSIRVLSGVYPSALPRRGEKGNTTTSAVGLSTSRGHLWSVNTSGALVRDTVDPPGHSRNGVTPLTGRPSWRC